MRFIHTADLHLGAKPDAHFPWGKERAEAVSQSLSRIIDACRREQADLLLIAGDLFHHQPLTSELKEVNYLFSTLEHTQVVLIAGNHDFVRPGTAYGTFEFAPNVSFLSSPHPESVYFPELNTEVHGFSYDRREIFLPLYQDMTPPSDDRLHILLAHGGDSSHIPINPAEITQKGWDYAALGHIHKSLLARSSRLAYPGSPEPLDSGETGVHGYISGELTKDSCKLTFVPLSDVQYIPLTIRIDPSATMASLRERLKTRLEENPSFIYKITIEGKRDPDISFQTDTLRTLGRCLSVADNSQPDYQLEDIRRSHSHDLIAFFIDDMTSPQEDIDPELQQKALYYGLDALLHPDL